MRPALHLLLAAGLLSGVAAAEKPLPERQVYIEYQLSGDGISPELSRGLQKVWRSGNDYARAQFQIDGQGGVVTVVAAPYAYVLETFGKRGTRLGGPSDPQSAHLPIYPLTGINGAHNLEYGYEMEFFKEHEAVRGKHEEIDGRECAVFRIRMEGIDGALYIDLKERAPKRLTLEREGRSLTVDYLRYERRQPFDPDLYKPPAGFQVQGAEVKRKDFDTPFDAIASLPDNLRLQESERGGAFPMGRCNARPIFLAFYEPAGRGEDAVSKELRGIYERYRETPFCLFFVPRDGRGATEQHGKDDVPRYRLVSYMELKGDAAARDYRPEDGSFVEVFKDNGLMERLPLDGDPGQIESKMQEALDEMGDLKSVAVGDIDEQEKTVDGELLKFVEGRRIVDMMKKKDFVGIEAVISDLRDKKLHASNGAWDLRSAYEALLSELNDDRSIKERRGFFERWAMAKSDSVTARIALAKLWRLYAWRGRGGHDADHTSRRQFEDFSIRLKEARRWLDEAGKLPTKDPELFTESLSVALGEGRDPDEVNRIFRAGQEVEPAYQYLYAEMAIHLFPKWHGAEGDFETFIDRVRSENPAGVGREMATRAVFILADQDEFGTYWKYLFRRTSLNWGALRDGWWDIIRRTPDSKMNLNYFARMACAAGDKVTALQVFDRIGDDYAVRVWGNRVVFERSRRWAEGPKDEQQLKGGAVWNSPIAPNRGQRMSSGR